MNKYEQARQLWRFRIHTVLGRVLLGRGAVASQPRAISSRRPMATPLFPQRPASAFDAPGASPWLRSRARSAP